jgi:hypothetical protein
MTVAFYDVNYEPEETHNDRLCGTLQQCEHCGAVESFYKPNQQCDNCGESDWSSYSEIDSFDPYDDVGDAVSRFFDR